MSCAHSVNGSTGLTVPVSCSFSQAGRFRNQMPWKNVHQFNSISYYSTALTLLLVGLVWMRAAELAFANVPDLHPWIDSETPSYQSHRLANDLIERNHTNSVTNAVISSFTHSYPSLRGTPFPGPSSEHISVIKF